MLKFVKRQNLKQLSKALKSSVWVWIGLIEDLLYRKLTISSHKRFCASDSYTNNDVEMNVSNTMFLKLLKHLFLYFINRYPF